MIGFLEILEIVKAIFLFPQTLLQVVRVLGKTPEDRHEDLLKSIQDEVRKFKETGRPKWD